MTRIIKKKKREAQLPKALPSLTQAITADQFAMVEQSIYEMLLAEQPAMADDDRRELAHEGARHAVSLRQQEIADGKEIPIYCVCTHSIANHVGGVGRCKYPTCDCAGAIPSEVRLGASDPRESGT